MLTTRQKRLLKFILDYSADIGEAPTQREMRAALDNCGMATVTRELARLEAAGLIERIPGTMRNVRIRGGA